MSLIPVYKNYINGAFHDSDKYFDVYNPATGSMLSKAPESSAQDVEFAIFSARAAQKDWARKPAIQRAVYLRKIANKLRENVDRLAMVITLEQGKISSLAKAEVNFTADYLDYMAEWARRIEGEIITSDRANENIFLFRKPLGVVAGILPWNFPLLLIARKMAPALLVGNTIVVKPSEETPNNCFEFAKLVAQVDLPPGVFNVVSGNGQVGCSLSASPGVDMISFTGSVATGSKIMSAAAENITKVNLELGGKAPAIVLADADLDLAADLIRKSRIINSGQACNCVDRVYVERKVAESFIDRISKIMASTRYGDPVSTPDVEMGPLINRKSLEGINQKVIKALQQGATLTTGGSISDLLNGFHFQPTVLVDCRPNMEIMRKEIFGPVLPIQIVEDLEEALAMANDCEYGLSSSIYTRDLNKAMHAVRELSFGETYINRENFEAVQGFHAGIKKSGIGGADGKHGLYEYTHTHVVYLQGQ